MARVIDIKYIIIQKHYKINILKIQNVELALPPPTIKLKINKCCIFDGTRFKLIINPHECHGSSLANYAHPRSSKNIMQSHPHGAAYLTNLI